MFIKNVTLFDAPFACYKIIKHSGIVFFGILDGIFLVRIEIQDFWISVIVLNPKWKSILWLDPGNCCWELQQYTKTRFPLHFSSYQPSCICKQITLFQHDLPSFMGTQSPLDLWNFASLVLAALLGKRKNWTRQSDFKKKIRQSLVYPLRQQTWKIMTYIKIHISVSEFHNEAYLYFRGYIKDSRALQASLSLW